IALMRIPAPDLLHPEGRLWLDAAELRQVLTFAFASGIGSDAFERALSKTAAAPSPLVPECFAKDLFVDDFVARCMPLRVGPRPSKQQRQALVALVTRPPGDPETVALRHAVLTELGAKPAYRAGLEGALAALAELSGLLESVPRTKDPSNTYRRVEILRSVRQAFDAVASAVPGATSALSRLDLFGTALRESEAYRHLVELLDHESHLATVDVRLRLARDGHVRAFEILRASENTANRFYGGPVRRFFMRLRLLFRGYRIGQDELLGRLLQTVFDGIEEPLILLFQVRRDIEFYLAALALRDFAAKKGLPVCLPTFERSSTPGAPLPDSRFERLYNPLLLLEEHAPRPSDLTIGGRAQLIVTGPNSGGKTRLLQAIGLAQLLAQAGFFVPAASATLAPRPGLFVSVVEEATADAREGRLGTELMRIRTLFERLAWGSLVIVDELCSGTNPSEAEEIFRLVLSQLAELEPQTVVTTHFLHFAANLAQDRSLPYLEFLQVELDETQTPTFGFVPGVATTSLARKTAERLGVTREALKGLVDEAKRAHAPVR
ncbi:MAG TPA: DNA mismatch repair protein, partial [Polyangiaceae bacterium]|nr:DNA mismatch repair protein [Polyangiaceae bacterium]